MSKNFKLTDTLTPGLKEFEKDAALINEKAGIAVALQLLNNCNNGSPKDATVPPIKTGNLRGSASVFLNSRLIGMAPKYNGNGTPAKSYTISVKKTETVITIIYNTSYAGKLHEKPFNLGVGSERAGNVGNKWISKHLDSDKDEFIYLFGIIQKKELYKE